MGEIEKSLYERRKLLYNMIYMKMGGYGMNCMKCGRETQTGQVFCPDCLEDMKKYPVNPTTTVRLPRRYDPQLAKKQVRRKAVPEEEQIRLLKKRVKLLSWLLAAAVALIIALTIPTVKILVEESISKLPGQNYSSAVSSSAGD